MFSELVSQADEMWLMKDLEELLPTIDIVILACPVDESSRGMINDEFLAYCKYFKLSEVWSYVN